MIPSCIFPSLLSHLLTLCIWLNSVSLNYITGSALTALHLMSLKPFGSVSGNVLSHPFVNTVGSTIPISASIKTLGVIFDTQLTFNLLCKSSYFHLRALRHICSMLTEDIAKSIAVALVSSRLDYANQFYLVHQPLTFTKFNEFKIPWLKLYLMTLYYHPLLLFAIFIGFLLNNAFTLKLLP